MREHDSLWVTCCTTCVHNAATHARFLLGDASENRTVLNLRAQLHNLTPIEYFYASPGALERDATAFPCDAFCEEKTCDDARFSKLVLVAVEKTGLQALVCVAYDDSSGRLFDLLEANRWTVGHVGVREDAISKDCTHNRC